ncbi:THAP domain-containing protein 3 isoform X1 [Alligator mississippiensis]|uniref:THAP domain-containing protein 3 isoform X1 n=1 Tax=Alligator mississippiensis TaxID=8496 RepID=UPI0006EC50C3|nr:THAP domain-containing protein 3 isoform X1 [Alligator mississippiensis]
MPKSCAAPRCSNRYSSRCRQLTFHRFPRSRPELLARWVVNLGRTDFQPSCHAVLCSQHFQPDCFSPCGNRANLRPDAVPTLFTAPPAAAQIGNGKSSLKDAEDPPVPKDSTDSWEDRRLDVEAVHQEPQSTTAEHPVEVTTTEAAEMEDRQLKSRPLVQRHHLQSSDHSYAIADCTSLKKKLFQALEENEKLRKCLKVKSVELKRILVRLQTCKKEH